MSACPPSSLLRTDALTHTHTQSHTHTVTHTHTRTHTHTLQDAVYMPYHVCTEPYRAPECQERRRYSREADM